MIILALAPCTAMVLVWTFLTRANLSCALIQVSINDLLILVVFTPIGMFLLGLTTGFHVPLDTLFLSVLLYVALPLGLGALTRMIIVKKKGEKWLDSHFISKVEKITPIGLLITLVLLFVFQGEKIIIFPYHIVLIAIPILVQTYLMFATSYFTTKKLRIPYAEAPQRLLLEQVTFLNLQLQ